ncbi:MAG: hypothetical protein AB2563_06125 [Candidatus Thiodiazotropha endolucinida]
MKTIITVKRGYFVILAIATLISGCASVQQQAITGGHLKLERVDSIYAHIGGVSVRASNEALTIRGLIRTTSIARRYVPGHLHIKVFDNNGVLLSETTSSYQKLNRNSRKLHFYKKLVSSIQEKATRILKMHHSHSKRKY